MQTHIVLRKYVDGCWVLAIRDACVLRDNKIDDDQNSDLPDIVVSLMLDFC